MLPSTPGEGSRRPSYKSTLPSPDADFALAILDSGSMKLRFRGKDFLGEEGQRRFESLEENSRGEGHCPMSV